jgi:hypothetical protein
MRYCVGHHTLARAVGNELVLVNLESGRIFSANGTAAALWRAIEQRDELDPVIESLVRSAPDALAARSEIETFLHALVTEHLAEAVG